CDTDTTTSDLTIGLPAPAIGVPVNGLISPGVTVDGLGLSFVSGLGNPLKVSNAGTVTTAEAVNALSLSGSGGDVLYTGNGSATNTAGMAAGLSISNTGTGIISATVGTRGLPGGPPTLSGSTGLLVEHSGSGPISIQVNNGSTVTGTAGDGIFASSTGGSNLTVRLEEGATTKTNNPISFWGIRADTQGGNGSNVITMNGTVIDGGILSSVVGTG